MRTLVMTSFRGNYRVREVDARDSCEVILYVARRPMIRALARSLSSVGSPWLSAAALAGHEDAHIPKETSPICVRGLRDGQPGRSKCGSSRKR